MPQTTIARLLAGLAVSALVMVVPIIGGCHKTPKNEQQTAAPSAPLPPPPLSIDQSNADAQVTLTLPEAIKLYPELHTRLYSEGQASLSAFIGQAHKDRAQNSADGIEEPPYYHSINWKIAAQSPRLVSLFSEEDDYQGGAHPNHSFQTLLWDKSGKTLIEARKLFKPGTDFKAIDAYVCHQIEAERSKRAGDPVSQSGSGFGCPKFAESHLILIPATTDGKIGAIAALYAPYDVGSYAEGPYEIRVPQAMLSDVIAPEFAGQFGGEPVKAPALTDPDAEP